MLIQHDGWVYIYIQKGIPDLKQAGKIAHAHVCTHMGKYEYTPVKNTPTLWKHETRDIVFTLMVDYFGIKFTNRQGADHLSSELEDLYVITKD